MRLGNGMGGVAAFDSRGTRRLLIAVLAFLLAAAGLVFGASPGHATESDPGTASFSLIDPFCEEVEGEEGSVDVQIMHDDDNGLGDMDLIELRLYESGEGWELVDTINDEGPLEDPIAEGDESGVYTFYDLDIDSTTYRVEADVEWFDEEYETSVPDTIVSSSFTVPDCAQTAFDCDEDDCSDITDPFGGNWTAEVDCDSCTVLIRDPGTNPDGSEGFADVEVSGTDLKVKLTATGKGTPPGKAAVWADDALLPKCKGKNATDCVKIKRIKGAHTHYDVRVGEDPRFRFR